MGKKLIELAKENIGIASKNTNDVMNIIEEATKTIDNAISTVGTTEKDEIFEFDVEIQQDELGNLKSENQFLRDELDRVTSRPQSNNSDITYQPASTVDYDKDRLLSFMSELENNMNGFNQQGIAWKEVKISYVLGKLREIFY